MKNLVKPDKEIDATWEDYKAGRDAVLEWVQTIMNAVSLWSCVIHIKLASDAIGSASPRALWR